MVDAVQNFAFHEDLVRIVVRNGRPWFVAADVCRALELKHVATAVDRLPAASKSHHNFHTAGGDQALSIISEGGLYRLTFKSRTAKAEEFVDWVADEVLPAIRETGKYDPRGDLPPVREPPHVDADSSFKSKLDCIRECRLIYGHQRAQVMWRTLGLPAVPPPPAPAMLGDEARRCLRWLLHSPPDADSNMAIIDLIEAAMDGNAEARATLLSAGIVVYPERDAFLIANQNLRLRAIFGRTQFWNHARILKRLPGSCNGQAKIEGYKTRGTILTAEYLDEGRLPEYRDEEVGPDGVNQSEPV